MTAEQLRALFFRTGLPEAYCLARERARREAGRPAERGDHDAVYNPGDCPAGDQVQRGG